MKKSLSILSLFLLSSCGFYSFTGASISTSVKTYSVKYFQNKANTINASLSNSFTEKLKDYFSTQTNLQQIDSDGDLSFEGDITSYTIKPIAIKANETARQNRLTIKIKVSFINKFDNKLSFNYSFSRYKDFPADEDLSSVEDIYMKLICDEIVVDVFNKSVVNW